MTHSAEIQGPLLELARRAALFVRQRRAPFALSLTFGLALSGCGVDFAGIFDGPATEAGSLTITVQGTGVEAKNEIAPHREEKTALTVTNHGDVVTAAFGDCKLEGKVTTSNAALVTNDCAVKLGAWEGKLPLTGTLTMAGPKEAMLEVVGKQSNGGTNVAYSYSFQGVRR